MLTKKIVALAGTICFLSVLHSQSLDTAKLNRLFNRILEKNKGMGSIAIAKGGKVLYKRHFGYAQVTAAGTKPITDKTEFRIASITKTYTAVMILQLVEEGKLKLTDNLDMFFPQIVNANKITITQLLLHRSGIPEIAEPGFRMGAKTHDQVLAAIAKGGSDFEPDTKSQYSNSGYVLLGYIVEKLDGKPYQACLQKRIVSKIGLKDTYLGIGNTDTARNEALSYRYLDEWKAATEMDFSVPAGAGAIISTPTDMLVFVDALFDGKLISKKSLDIMKTIRDGEGMGLVTFSFAGRTQYGNTGGSNTSGSWLAYDPQEKLSLAYATNAKIYPVSEIIKGVFDIYWNLPYEIPALTAFEVSPQVLDRYVGTYSIAGAPSKMIVTRKESALYIQNGTSNVPLEAESENTFKIGPGVTLEFDAAKRTLTIKRPQGERIFTKEN